MKSINHIEIIDTFVSVYYKRLLYFRLFRKMALTVYYRALDAMNHPSTANTYIGLGWLYIHSSAKNI